jgi:hypothetical protein
MFNGNSDFKVGLGSGSGLEGGFKSNLGLMREICVKANTGFEVIGI